ncbi:MAG: hypothetical protein M1812_000481 [Candelaria pacifica]|nr:MAG: hypothetical protein M1812_000481 [Candelaria pacifica]
MKFDTLKSPDPLAHNPEGCADTLTELAPNVNCSYIAVSRETLDSVKASVPPEIAARTIDNKLQGDGGKVGRHIKAMFEWVRMEKQRADAAEAREQKLQDQLSQYEAAASLWSLAEGRDEEATDQQTTSHQKRTVWTKAAGEDQEDWHSTVHDPNPDLTLSQRILEMNLD